jgi:hypothetical protein
MGFVPGQNIHQMQLRAEVRALEKAGWQRSVWKKWQSRARPEAPSNDLVDSIVVVTTAPSRPAHAHNSTTARALTS